MNHRTVFLRLLFGLLAGMSVAAAPSQQPIAPCALFRTVGDFIAFQSESAAAPVDAHGETPRYAHLAIYRKSVVARAATGRIVLPKDSLFGYMDRHQTCYRWDARSQSAYEIVSVGHLIIYRTYEAPYGGKSLLPCPVLHFSLRLDSPILPLTVPAVKAAFPSQLALHQLLDDLPDAALIAQRDPASGQFMLQILVQQFVLDDSRQ